MKSSDNWATCTGVVATTVKVLLLAVIAVGLAFTPVLADRDHHGDRDRHGPVRHEGHGRYYWHGEYYDYPPPGYYAPPPPPVYSPPAPPPGISFVFPIHIR